MTSVLKRYAQLDKRTQFFVPLASSIPTYTFASNRHTGVADISDVVTPSVLLPVTSNTGRLKDLGNTVYVYDDDSNSQRVQVAVMRLVQPVTGADTEGSNASPVWIATWVADPTVGISVAPVARTG